MSKSAAERKRDQRARDKDAGRESKTIVFCPGDLKRIEALCKKRDLTHIDKLPDLITALVQEAFEREFVTCHEKA